MKLLTFQYQDQSRTAALLDSQVLLLQEAAQYCGEQVDVTSMLAIIRGGAATQAALQRVLARRAELTPYLLTISDADWQPPIPAPVRNIFCVGRNYLEHLRESTNAMGAEAKLPEVPQFFTKATHAANAPYGEVLLFPVAHRYDYEVELVVVIGKRGRDIAATDAMQYVFGYCVGNDVTARDLQRRHEQWFKGKSLDTSFPFGPCITTVDEVPEVGALQLSMRVNGELRQQALASQMIFSIPALIESLSAGMTLEPGDLIATGTPSGVGFAMNPPQYLQHGDELVTKIEGLGELRNRVGRLGE